MTPGEHVKHESTDRLSGFVRRLAAELHRLKLDIEPYTVLAAVSGGADSTALLMALSELTKRERLAWRIIVVHLDHRLRSSSKSDREWVAKFAESLGLAAVISSADILKRAARNRDNLEQAARRARYEFFERTAKSKKATIVVTGHTLDDQAETVLLRLLRGSAADGLAGIDPIRNLNSDSGTRLVRPLVTWARRADTEAFCITKGIQFRVDSMNDDEQFDRVRVRKQLLPLMQSFNPRIVETLGRSASLLRDDADALSAQAEMLLRSASKTVGRTKAVELNVTLLASAAPAIRRRTLRLWVSRSTGNLRRLEMVHFLAVERLLEKRSGRTVELPNGIRVVREGNWLHLFVKTVEKGGFDL